MGHHSLASPVSGPQPCPASPLSIFLPPSTLIQWGLAWAQGSALLSNTPSDSDAGVP